MLASSFGSVPLFPAHPARPDPSPVVLHHLDPSRRLPRREILRVSSTGASIPSSRTKLAASHQFLDNVLTRVDLVNGAVQLLLLSSSLDELMAIILSVPVRIQASIGMKKPTDVQRSAEDHSHWKPFRSHSSCLASVLLDTRITASASSLLADTPHGVSSIVARERGVLPPQAREVLLGPAVWTDNRKDGEVRRHGSSLILGRIAGPTKVRDVSSRSAISCTRGIPTALPACLPRRCVVVASMSQSRRYR